MELPPHGGTVLCGAQAAGDLPNGHNFQRIEYVVNEVIEPSDTENAQLQYFKHIESSGP